MSECVLLCWQICKKKREKNRKKRKLHLYAVAVAAKSTSEQFMSGSPPTKLGDYFLLLSHTKMHPFTAVLQIGQMYSTVGRCLTCTYNVLQRTLSPPE